jgi:acetylornithine deacetylase
MISGGEWWVSFPASCNATLDITYLPAQADADGFGTSVEQEIEQAVQRTCERDDWLAANPPTVTWSVDLPPNEVDATADIVTSINRATNTTNNLATLDSWYDASAFTRIASMPAVAFGPAGEIDGRPIPHTIDECVPVADLVATAEGLALAAVDFIGLAR